MRKIETLPFTFGELTILRLALEEYSDQFAVQYPTQCSQIIKLAKRIRQAVPARAE